MITAGGLYAYCESFGSPGLKLVRLEFGRSKHIKKYLKKWNYLFFLWYLAWLGWSHTYQMDEFYFREREVPPPTHVNNVVATVGVMATGTATGSRCKLIYYLYFFFLFVGAQSHDRNWIKGQRDKFKGVITYFYGNCNLSFFISDKLDPRKIYLKTSWGAWSQY